MGHTITVSGEPRAGMRVTALVTGSVTATDSV